MKLKFETIVPCELSVVKKGFTKDLFMALKPPFVTLNVERFDGCSAGNEVHLNLKSIGPAQKWVSHITDEQQTDKEWFFIDEGFKIPWPLAKWKHVHKVVSINDKSSLIVDDINFDCVFPWMNGLFYPVLWLSFSVRPSRYKKYFEGK